MVGAAIGGLSVVALAVHLTWSRIDVSIARLLGVPLALSVVAGGLTLVDPGTATVAGAVALALLWPLVLGWAAAEGAATLVAALVVRAAANALTGALVDVEILGDWLLLAGLVLTAPLAVRAAGTS